jgi:sugar/nucleoside kinase (ribokinase family)
LVFTINQEMYHMPTEKDMLIAVGNMYLDNNIFGVNNEGGNDLQVGKDYFADKSEVVVGGSAVNFAMQAIKLGMRGAFLGQVGDDENGKEAKRLLEQKGISSDLVITAPGVTTSVAINMIFARTGEFIGVHSGDASANLDPKQINIRHPLFQRAAAVYFGGTVKQKKVIENFPQLLRSLQETGIQIIVDPNRFLPDSKAESKEMLLKSLKYVDCYLPNEEEILQMTGQDNLDEALDSAFAQGVALIVVKLGAKGCRVKTKDLDFQAEGYNIKPITTVGAGDAFNAGFVISWLEKRSLEECAKFANAAAAVKVSKDIYPTRDEIKLFLSNYSA